MNFGEKLLQQLFGNQLKNHEKPKETNSQIVRNLTFAYQFEDWKKRPETIRFFIALKSSIISKMLNQNNLEIRVNIFESLNANGFYFEIPQIFKPEAEFIAAYFEEKIKPFNYYTANHQSKTVITQKNTSETQFLYLKPKRSFTENGNQIQLFGNISIETKILNNQLQYLKFMVTTYSGRNYEPSKSFGQFIDQLF